MAHYPPPRHLSHQKVVISTETDTILQFLKRFLRVSGTQTSHCSTLSLCPLSEVYLVSLLGFGTMAAPPAGLIWSAAQQSREPGGRRSSRILADLQPNQRPDTLHALSSLWGRRCPLLPRQYLLIPKILTPCSWGSLGMSTVSRETVLTTKWTRSYLV